MSKVNVDYQLIPRFRKLLTSITNYCRPEVLRVLIKHFHKIFKSREDSLLTDVMYPQFLRLLKSKDADWRDYYYTIPLAATLEDSTLNALVLRLGTYDHPGVRMAVYEQAAKMKTDRALAFLINRFTELREGFEKALLCRYIAKVAPQKAYLLINQNLDKGDPFFQRELVSALGEIRLNLAIRTLKQFLNVNNPLLVNAAFEALARMHALSRKDIEVMLASDDFSCVATALIWALKRNFPLQTDTALELYKKFDYPLAFEVQLQALKLLAKEGKNLSFDITDSLIAHLAHPLLVRQYQKIWPSFSEFSAKISLTSLPSYLHPDSLLPTGEKPKYKVVTNRGEFIIELFPKIAPLTVRHFEHLAQSGFYTNLYFHRSVTDFVVQVGDPTATGWGGCNYIIPSEHCPLPFKKGSIGMATAGFDTGNSQFFICQSRQPHLDGNYTQFGRVIEGMDIVEKIIVGDKILSIERIP